MAAVDSETIFWSEWDAGWRCVRGRASDEVFASATQALSRAVIGARLTPDEEALARTLDRLYSSEINVRVTRTADGWKGEIGDDWNGFSDASSVVPLRVLLDWLPSAVCRVFPQSEYARARPT